METHIVTTEDKTDLTIFRLPFSAKLKNENTTKQVVFLMHGASSSSDCFILNGPENSIAYILSNAGYDVWLGNSRGNRYSSNIIPSWDFSFEQSAYYDLPASLDYILNVTKQSDLHYIAHSQGTTIYFIMLSELPKYNKVIRTAHLLAPAAYMSNIRIPWIGFLGRFYGWAPTWYSLVNGFNIWPSFVTDIIAYTSAWLCGEHSISRHVCSNVLFSMCGFNAEHLNYVSTLK